MNHTPSFMTHTPSFQTSTDRRVILFRFVASHTPRDRTKSLGVALRKAAEEMRLRVVGDILEHEGHEPQWEKLLTAIKLMSVPFVLTPCPYELAGEEEEAMCRRGGVPCSSALLFLTGAELRRALRPYRPR